MSYIATVYTHREDGASIVYADNFATGGLYTFTGSDSAGYKTGSLTGDTIFTAVIPYGYTFKQWVYRLKSATGTLQHNTANPFTYTLGMDVYIWAEIEEDDGGGGGGDGGDTTYEWTNPQGETMETIDTVQMQTVTLNPYNLYTFTIRTKYSGTLTAYTVGNLDTKGYLTTGLQWDRDEGVPYSIKAENDDDEDRNFRLTYEVTAGTTYHLWVRCYDPDVSGSVTVIVEPPGSQQGGQGTQGGTLYVYDATRGWVECTPLVYADGKWNECSLFIASDG